MIIINKTAQQFFDDTLTHFAKQKIRAISKKNGVSEKNLCKYRVKIGDETLRCAVGAHFNDNDYVESMEGRGIDDLVEGGVISIGDLPIQLLRELQTAHDSCYNLESLKEHLFNIADLFYLDGTKIDLIESWE